MKNNYKVIHYFSQEDQCYLAFAPELPGCFADGVTLQGCLSNLDNIISEWIEVAKEENRIIPIPASNNYESTKPSVFDVSKYILIKTGAISTMTLEKLSYYCLVWSLVWFNHPIFNNKFQAWKDGPVCKDLFSLHKGKRIISADSINSEHIFSNSELMVMNSVISIYGRENGEFLSALTHQEEAWLSARGKLSPKASSNTIITNEIIKKAYSY